MRIASAIIMAVVLLPAGAAAQSSNASEGPVVITVGEGSVKRAPDQAWVTIAAESRAKTPADAQKQNADAMAAVLQRVKSLGLPPDAIQTAGYELRPEFDYANNKQTLRGYVARNSIDIRVDDLAKLGQVLDVAVAAGATSIGGIRFDLKERTNAEQLALQRAVADARTQANTAAQAAGMRVERVVRIEVQREPVMPPPRPMMVRAEMGLSAAEPPIAAGELEVKARVVMTSAIR